MRTSPAPPRISLAARLLAGALAVLVSAGVGEAAARLFFPAPPQLGREPQLRFQSDPELGFFHVADQRGYLDDGLASINDLGLRGARPQTPKPANSVRVLAIGDSTTFGWGVGDDETYQAVLESRLAAAFPERRPGVVNAGVSSYDLEQSAKLLERLAPVLCPDLVLVGFFWNDLPYEGVAPDGDAGPGRPAMQAASVHEGPSSPQRTFRMANQPSGLNGLLRRSRLLFALRHAWLARVAPTDAATNQVRWEQAILDGRSSGAIDAAWHAVGRTMGRIRRLADTGGFAVGVVIIPIRAQVEQDHPNAAYQSRVRDLARSVGLFVIDPLPAFRAAPNPGGLFIPYDRMHLSPAGNALLGEAVFEALRARPEFGGTQ